MFVPFYSTMFLAFESGNVIGLRMMKMIEAGANLMAGGTTSGVVDRYREHVAANAKRLSH